MSTHTPVNVICLKWGTKYGPDFVNKLYAMVARHLTLDFNFYCFTEHADGIRSEVSIRDLPSLDLPAGLPERGWLKLSTFAESLADLTGPTLFLDLDVVIVDNIDGFFTYGDPTSNTVHLAFDEKKRTSRIGNSSVYRFNIGEHTDVLAYFRNNFDKVRSNHRNEQAYLSKQLDAKNNLAFWPTEWCPSFKYHCIPKFPLNFVRKPRLPKGAKIILFHGLPEPEDASKGTSGKWYRYLKPTDWINEHWRE